jgi:hypothetical protein
MRDNVTAPTNADSTNSASDFANSGLRRRARLASTSTNLKIPSETVARVSLSARASSLPEPANGHPPARSSR